MMSSFDKGRGKGFIPWALLVMLALSLAWVAPALARGEGTADNPSLKVEEPAAVPEPAASETEEPETEESEAEEEAADEEAVDEERSALLRRWDELMRRRAQLRRELADVEGELRRLRRQLWPANSSMDEMWRYTREKLELPELPTQEDWDRVREDLRRRTEEVWEDIAQRLSQRGEEILPWIPDALVERWAQKTDRTPEEVREMIRSGQWAELFWLGDFQRTPSQDGEEAAPEQGADDEQPEAAGSRRVKARPHERMGDSV